MSLKQVKVPSEFFDPDNCEDEFRVVEILSESPFKDDGYGDNAHAACHTVRCIKTGETIECCSDYFFEV